MVSRAICSLTCWFCWQLHGFQSHKPDFVHCCIAVNRFCQLLHAFHWFYGLLSTVACFSRAICRLTGRFCRLLHAFRRCGLILHVFQRFYGLLSTVAWFSKAICRLTGRFSRQLHAFHRFCGLILHACHRFYGLLSTVAWFSRTICRLTDRFCRQLHAFDRFWGWSACLHHFRTSWAPSNRINILWYGSTFWLMRIFVQEAGRMGPLNVASTSLCGGSAGGMRLYAASCPGNCPRTTPRTTGKSQDNWPHRAAYPPQTPRIGQSCQASRPSFWPLTFDVFLDYPSVLGLDISSRNGWRLGLIS